MRIPRPETDFVVISVILVAAVEARLGVRIASEESRVWAGCLVFLILSCFPLMFFLLVSASLVALGPGVHPSTKEKALTISATCNFLLALCFCWRRHGIPGPLAMTAIPLLSYFIYVKIARLGGWLARGEPMEGPARQRAGEVIAWAAFLHLQACMAGLAVMHAANWVPSSEWPSAERFRGRIYSIMPAKAEAMDLERNVYQYTSTSNRLQKFRPDGRLDWVASPHVTWDDDYEYISFGRNDVVVMTGDHGHRDEFHPPHP